MNPTKIEWADSTWNPVTGCTPVSPACANCYARRMATRLRGRCGYPANDPFAVTLHPDRLEEPLRWRKPRRIFTVSMGDLFHEDVPEEYISRVWGVMSLASQHTYLVLTKRSERMAEIVPRLAKRHAAGDGSRWPLPNVWLGVTAEDQQRANERIPYLLQTPAAVRWVSVEPMLGPVRYCVDLRPYIDPLGHLDWIVCGGETGPGARPMHPSWVRALRDHAIGAGVPFFFKSWGDWLPCGAENGGPSRYSPRKPNYTPEQLAQMHPSEYAANGRPYQQVSGPVGAKIMVRVGKLAAGRLLDGRAWDECPEVAVHD